MKTLILLALVVNMLLEYCRYKSIKSLIINFKKTYFMKTAELKTLLEKQTALLKKIAGGVDKLQDAIANADNVPEDVATAANELKTTTDAIATDLEIPADETPTAETGETTGS